MRRRYFLPVIAAALSLGAVATTAHAAASSTRGDNDCSQRDSRGDDLAVVGLVADGTLVCFDSDRPQRADAIGRVSGRTDRRAAD